ncbi:peptide deformylase [Hwanghaeella sp.]|uniref:peptide deformylase n=1 Tax=Hwanghaeella sp. TaxID=2605943 RepID=UPI003CCBDF35
MAILKIARMGHPVLRRKADPVADPTAPETRHLVADMIETMQDAGGTGLAAPQVHVPARVIVYFVSKTRLEEGEEEVPLTALVNPVLTPIGKEKAYGWEGCLSVPGLTGLVPRFETVRLQAITPRGDVIDKTVSGFHARVLQHEIDHLDGTLYPQRMDDLSLLLFQEEMRYGMPERAKELMEVEDDREVEEA